jgi:polysaccharide pyruvyl transferase WcaK-like protein
MSSKIPILGYYDHNNAGDEAFKLAFSGALGNTPHEFVKGLPRDREIPLVLFGGGALLNEYFVQHLSNARKIYAIGCSFPYGANDIKIFEPIRDRIASLYLRSRKDVEAARAAGYDAKFIPDMVFSVPPQSGMNLEQMLALAALPPRNFKTERKKLFVFLSGDYWVDYLKGDRKRFEKIELLKERIAKTLDAAVQKYDVIMPSMSVWYSARDYIFAGEVLKRMKHPYRVGLIERYIDATDLLSVLAQTDCAVLSMKYHGLVFGMLNGRVCINIGSTRKTIDLMEDFGVPDLTFDPDKDTSEQLMALLSRAEEEPLQKQIADTAKVWKIQAVSTMRQAVDHARESCEQLTA